MAPASANLALTSPSRSLAAGSSANVARIDIFPRSGRLTTPTSYSHGFRSPSALTTSFSASSAPSALLNFKMHTSMINSFRARFSATGSAREDPVTDARSRPALPPVESHKLGAKSASVFRVEGQVLFFVKRRRSCVLLRRLLASKRIAWAQSLGAVYRASVCLSALSVNADLDHRQMANLSGVWPWRAS